MRSPDPKTGDEMAGRMGKTRGEVDGSKSIE